MKWSKSKIDALWKKKKLNFNLGKSFFKKKNMVFTEWKEGT